MSKDNSKSKFVFGTLGIGQPGVQAQITNVYEPSASEIKSYRSATSRLNRWLRTYSETFALVEHTYFRFKDIALKIEQDFKQTPSPDTSRAMLAINAEFLSFLVMVRLYLDHTETKLKRSKHGNAAGELQTFKEATAFEYDNRFAYRFCYRLRNFAQHCGFPITGMDAHSGYIEGTTDIEHSFEVSFVRDYLLEKFGDWSIVKGDLEQQSEQFPVLAVSDDMMVALRQIHRKTLRSYLSRLEPLTETINAMLAHTTNVPGQPCLFEMQPLISVPGGGLKQNVTLHKVPFELLKMMEDIKALPGS